MLFVAMTPLFAFSAHPGLTGVALFAMGLGQGAFATMQSTLVFLAVPPARRTQAMALLTVCIGVAPLGFLFLGWLAQRLGASLAVLICAVCAVAALALTARHWRKLLRRASVA
jgi:MFS family permease